MKQGLSVLFGLLSLAGALTVAPKASANGAITNVLVTELQISGSVARVRFSGNIGTSGSPTDFRPSCIASGWSNYFMFDHTTAQGKSYLATLTAAMIAGKHGSGTLHDGTQLD